MVTTDAILVSLIGKSWKSILTPPPLPPLPLQMLGKCTTTELHHPLFILCVWGGVGGVSVNVQADLKLAVFFLLQPPKWLRYRPGQHFLSNKKLVGFSGPSQIKVALTLPPFSGAHCNYELLVLLFLGGAETKLTT